MERRSALEEPKSPNKATPNEKKALQYIEEITSNVDEVQRKVLADILSQNAHVEYLQRHNLNGHTDRETFKKVVPIITYEDIQHDINRIANGDKSPILCSQPIAEFLTSSGTSGGESKLIPVVEGEIMRRAQIHGSLLFAMSQVVTDYRKGKGMNFSFIRSEDKTHGGILARPFLTSILKATYFMTSVYHTSPTETVLCPDTYQSMYSQLLCGLCQNEQVYWVGSMFAGTLIRVIQFLENHWSLLCNDIRTGTISTQILTDPSVREAVLKILKPDPKLADFIEAECCSKDSWKGIITRLWPNAKYMEVIVTGSMSQYIPTLDYYSNSLPLVSIPYACSESYFGVNLNPFCKPNDVSYTLIPTAGYFEFLPYHQDNKEVINPISMPKSLNEEQRQELVDLADVKIGQDYELIVTTNSGLYRYRVGDVLRVAAYKNDAPQFNFICRGNVILDIDAEKTSEVELQNAVTNAVGNLMPFDAHLTEYTSYIDISTVPNHYVLFWELTVNASTPIPPSVFEDCCLTMEESLNLWYRKARASDKSIGPLEIKIVEKGTFIKLMDYCVSLGASMSQYKTPRCVKFAPHIELLNSGVVSTYFSPTYPKWAPGYKKWDDAN